MSDAIKRMPVAEFREFGYLQEVNRLFLHPLGLALEVEVHEDGTTELSGVWDYRDDPEGIRYSDDLDLGPKAGRVADEWTRRGQARIDALGYMVQPAP